MFYLGLLQVESAISRICAASRWCVWFVKAPSIFWRYKITVLKVFLRTLLFWSYKVNVLIIADNLTYYALIVKHQWFYQLLTIYSVSKLHEYVTHYILVLTHWVILYREYINCNVALLCINLVYNIFVYVVYIYE